MEQEQDKKVSKAISAMKKLGIAPQTVKPVLSRLLKLYDGNWELIEEDNFRTLADSIFENADDEQMAEENSDMVNEDVKPSLKKQKRGLVKDVVLSTEDKQQNVENSKDDRAPKTGKRMVEPFPVSRDLDPVPHRRVGQDQRGSKHKDLIRTNANTDEEKSFTRRASSSIHANREPNDVGLALKMRRTTDDRGDENVVVPRKKLRFDRSPPLGSVNTLQQSDSRNKKNKSSSGYDHQTTYDIASSSGGHVKLSLNCSQSLQQQNLYIPSADEFLRFAESHCQKFCATSGTTHYSVVRLLNELCQGFFETIGKEPSRYSESSDSNSLAIVQEKPVFYKINDITKGTENVKISLLDEIGTEPLPRFSYCPGNIAYESAYVHTSLARISDEDCCRKCRGNCLSSNIPCACARDTGGEYAYTLEGLLTEKFLESCISMKVEPRDQDLFYCQDCPLERAKESGTHEKCKGHLMRKFIKECWRKCTCNMKCGNRVVQRGITRNLQVFLTGKGKGWGLRTLEELPKGAFVCEYVGEILTNIELYERNKKNKGNDKHVYPVLLDADWATEGVLKDEDALCLDATHYGNVARFINHRCFDGNIIEVPVQVETPDRHYYRLAFFTKRKVDVLEELTWDYGIDFDDDSHPIKAFRCCCGSQDCRDTKRAV